MCRDWMHKSLKNPHKLNAKANLHNLPSKTLTGILEELEGAPSNIPKRVKKGLGVVWHTNGDVHSQS